MSQFLACLLFECAAAPTQVAFGTGGTSSSLRTYGFSKAGNKLKNEGSLLNY